MEEWRDVLGYEGIYKISNLGNIKSIERISTNGKRLKEKFLYTHLINGYRVVSLYKCGKQKNCKIHRLVAEAFLPNPNKKPCVDHIDTNKENNTVENLRWVTYQENTDNPISSKLQKNAVSNTGCVMVAQYDKNNNLINIFPSASVAQKITGTHYTNICNCCRGRRPFANGFIWKYYDK